ncbi:putative DNA-binding protein YlxM (UPF0122 family) [Paenibacillus turicensis]|uniref:DNA-binding protein YlxM (UPF0122 family) n=1 Tax=Paenibacillus turicensis TaxID=160487 RepID=A0ABS4FUS3_9BACL|nr:hypothetical protein [Paenibacillus turicensis]MBP1906323.1 putative DNA-binding protein YlxM (UPF0122 family) [Paenibacillus turicensis]
MKNTLSKGLHIINNGTEIYKELFPYSGENNHCSKLKENEVRQIRLYYNRGLCTRQELANCFKVSISTINDIINYRTWKHIGSYHPTKEVITATRFVIHNKESQDQQVITLVHTIIASNSSKLLDILSGDDSALLTRYPTAVFIGEYLLAM